MTDELSIQAQQPQRTSPMPYVLGGAAVGAAAGGFSPVGVTKPKYSSYEDILKESNDTFDKGIEKGGDNKSFWEAAKEHAEKVKNAEAEYDKKVEEIKNAHKSAASELPSNNEAAKKLAEAQKNYEAELKTLTDNEKSKLRVGNGRVTEFPTRKTLQNELSSAEFKKFESFLNDYETARTNLLGKPGTKYYGGSIEPMYKNIKSQKKDVNKMYEDIFNNHYEKLADKDKAKFDPSKGKVGKEIDKTIDILLPEKYGNRVGSGSRYNYNQFKELQERFGQEMFEIVDKNPGNTSGKGVFKVNNGSKDVWVVIDNAAVTAKRNAMKTEYAANIKRTIDLQTQLKNLDTEFFKENEAILKNDLKNPIKSASDLSKNLKLPSVYKDALNAIDVIEIGLNKGINKYPVTIGTDVIRNADELRVLKMQIQTEKEIAEKYVLKGTKITNELKEIVRSDVRVDSAYKKMQKAIKEDKGVQNAIDAVERKLNGKYASDADKALYEKVQGLMKTESALTESEITAQAEEAAKKAIEGKDVASKLKAAQEAAEAEAKKLGLTAKELTEDELKKLLQEKGLGTKEEYTTKVRNAAKEVLEKDMGKIKTPNRWVNGAIAALALAGVGYLVAPKNDQA